MSESPPIFLKASRYDVLDCRQPGSFGGLAVMSVSHEDGRYLQSEHPFAVVKVTTVTRGRPMVTNERREVFLYAESERKARVIADALNLAENANNPLSAPINKNADTRPPTANEVSGEMFGYTN